MMAIIPSAGRAPPSCLLAPRTAHFGVASYSLTETAEYEYSDTLLAPENAHSARFAAHLRLRTTRLSEFSDTLLAQDPG